MIGKKLKKVLITIILLSNTLFTRHAMASYECTGPDCPPELRGIQVIVIRIFTALITLFGIVLLFVVITSAISVMTAGDNEENRIKSLKKLQKAGLGAVLFLLAYAGIVFFASWIGLVDSPFSFIKGGRIIFDFMLPD